MMNIRQSRILAFGLLMAALTACGTGSKTTASTPANVSGSPTVTTPRASAFTVQPVGVRLLTQSAAVAPAPSWAPMAVPATGTLTVDEAVLNIRYVEFKLPEGVTCGKYDSEVKKEDERDQQEQDALAEKAKDRADQGKADLKDGSGSGKEQGDLSRAPGQDTTPLVDRPATDVEGGRHGRSRKAICRGDKFRFEGPFHVSLTDGVSNPPLENLAVPPGLYRQVKLKIDNVEQDNSEGRIAGRSLVLNGTYSDAVTSFPVRLGLKFDEEIEFEAPGGISIATNGGEDFVIRFPVQDWLKGIDLSKCEARALRPGSTLVMDEEDGQNDCAEFEDAFKKNFKSSGKAEREVKEKENESTGK